MAGIAALFTCALVVDPARVFDSAHGLADLNQTHVLHGLVIPLLAGVGLWLVLPNLTVLALCTLLLALAHSRWGSPDLFAGYLYPAVALLAGFALLRALLQGNST